LIIFLDSAKFEFIVEKEFQRCYNDEKDHLESVYNKATKPNKEKIRDWANNLIFSQRTRPLGISKATKDDICKFNAFLSEETKEWINSWHMIGDDDGYFRPEINDDNDDGISKPSTDKITIKMGGKNIIKYF